MMTVKQVSTLTGVSVRTLQFYDEIGLFQPTEMTEAGYRLYDEHALEAVSYTHLERMQSVSDTLRYHGRITI